MHCNWRAIIMSEIKAFYLFVCSVRTFQLDSNQHNLFTNENFRPDISVDGLLCESPFSYIYKKFNWIKPI